MNEECLESRYEMRFPSLILASNCLSLETIIPYRRMKKTKSVWQRRTEKILLEVAVMLCIYEKNFMQQPFNMLCHSCANILIMNEKIVHNDLSYKKILIKQN